LQFVRHNEVGVIRLEGGPATGKTTALRHLAAVLPRDARVRLFDDEVPHDLRTIAREHLAVVSAAEGRQFAHVARVAMEPWGVDDLIEYLLSVCPQRCAEIMARVRACDDTARLAGSPALWRCVLDAFLADGSMRFAASALRRRVFDALEAGRCKTAALIWCLKRARAQHTFFELPDAVRPLLAQPFVQVLVGAEHLADLLSAGKVRGELSDLRPELVRETALLLRGRTVALATLEEEVRRGRDSVPAAASILAAVDPAWAPPKLAQINLAKAVLDRVQWSGVDLSSANLRGAGLSRANLCAADLHCARAFAASFRGAKLRRASLRAISAGGADFSGADLGLAALSEADLTGALLERANLERAVLRGANLTGAKLAGACLLGADLTGAVLGRAVLDDADLTRADFTCATLERVRLAGAKLTGARLCEARLARCDLEDLRADDVDFTSADLRGSLLTGSILRRAGFRGAKFAKTGLANVDWPGADLRGADLRGATFHLGSSRSGLVGSTIPCEGSKTGFYADTTDELEYKPPEEVRTANLQGADLRGAKVKGVDFYRVDLRGARYTRKQARHFRACGAIL
jgi:uncharacterized protein YjbI with pentapeptide repeats